MAESPGLPMMSGAGTSRGNNPDQGISTIASGATTAGEVTQDFQTPTKRSPKKRKLSLTPDKVPGSAVKAGAGCGDEEPEGQYCPICFEEWTNSGTHRLASLKCGHLFGQSCIEKWLRGQGGKCPQCNCKAQRKDIRVIYAKAIKMVDTSERDRAVQALDAEKEARRRAELEAAQARLRYQMAVDECNRLRGEVARQTQQLEALRSQATPQPSQGSPAKAMAEHKVGGSYSLDRHVKIWEAGGCRVMAYCEAMGLLCVSQPSSSPLFPGFGVKKVSILDYRSSQYVAIHSKMIRDMAFNSTQQDGILLSAAMDKTLRMTSLFSNTVVQTYQCPMPVWSCAWDLDDKNYLYAGLGNGRVCVFDIRNTAGSVRELNTEASRSPVVSLQYAKHTPDRLFRPGGLIIGQFESSAFYEKIGTEEFKPHALPNEGNLTSLHLEEESRKLLATYRPTTKHPSVRHVVYNLNFASADTDGSGDHVICQCSCQHTFHAGSTQKLLTRSCLVEDPHDLENRLVCSGDEASSSVHIWEVRSSRLRQKISFPQPIIDLCPVVANDNHHLLALSDKQVSFLKWS